MDAIGEQREIKLILNTVQDTTTHTRLLHMVKWWRAIDKSKATLTFGDHLAMWFVICFDEE